MGGRERRARSSPAGAPPRPASASASPPRCAARRSRSRPGTGTAVWLASTEHDGAALAAGLAAQRIYVTPGTRLGRRRARARSRCATARRPTGSALRFPSFRGRPRRSDPARSAVDRAGRRTNPEGDTHVLPRVRVAIRRSVHGAPGRGGVLGQPLDAERAAHERVDAAEVRVGARRAGCSASATSRGWPPRSRPPGRSRGCPSRTAPGRWRAGRRCRSCGCRAPCSDVIECRIPRCASRLTNFSVPPAADRRRPPPLAGAQQVAAAVDEVADRRPCGARGGGAGEQLARVGQPARTRRRGCGSRPGGRA